jgi:hypothetical protein
MPEKEGEVFHIISMNWFAKWKKYVHYDELLSTAPE